MLPVQCKMARVAIGWGIRDLARIASVSSDTVIRLERGESIKEATIERLRITFKAAGIEFDDGDAPGVRLRRLPGIPESHSDAGAPRVSMPEGDRPRLEGGLPVRLQRLRARYGASIGKRLTQPKFAALLGIEGPRYGSYERGTNIPPLDVLITLRRVTGVSLDELIDG